MSKRLSVLQIISTKTVCKYYKKMFKIQKLYESKWRSKPYKIDCIDVITEQ